MSHRRGYDQEYKVKLFLIKRYGKENVVKAAVSQQCPDFLCFKKIENNLCFPEAWEITAYEVKSRHTKTYKANDHDKEQFHIFTIWNMKNSIPVRYLITLNKGAPFQEYTLEQYEKSFIEPIKEQKT